MGDEKLRILEMVQSGKITAAEGVELLDALNEEGNTDTIKPAPILSDRFLVVKVNSAGSKVNVNVPINLLKATSKFVTVGMSLIPEEARREIEKKGIDIAKFDFEELINLLDQGLADGRLVDVETDDQHGVTKVEVYVQ